MITTENFTGCVLASPVGELTLLATDKGIAGLYFEDRCCLPWQAGDSRWLERGRMQLEEYFAGERREFELPLDMRGTDFQRAVWEALVTVKFGETASYREIAEKIGNPKAVRAVGLANGRNPVSLIVPCHRVIGADGSLTGYGGGMERKRYLLAMESGEDLLLENASGFAC
jgi:methylated-DNA-[protein]-cysteine S-methyltransferase